MSSGLSWRDALVVGAAMTVGGASTALAQAQFPVAPRRKLAVSIVNTTGNAALTFQHLIRQQGLFRRARARSDHVERRGRQQIDGAIISGGSDICAMSGFSQVLPDREGRAHEAGGPAGQPSVQTIYTTRPNIRTTAIEGG
jgi:hypothetical protein